MSVICFVPLVVLVLATCFCFRSFVAGFVSCSPRSFVVLFVVFSVVVDGWFSVVC